MKFIILASVVALAYAAHHLDTDDVFKYLKEIESSQEFYLFSPEDKTLYQGLLAAAGMGATELNDYITKNGFLNILKMVDHMKDDDIRHFESVLSYYAEPNHLGGNFLGKRQATSDLYEWMQELHAIDKIQDDMHHGDKAVFLKLMYNAEHNTLTQYLNQIGYAEAFRILSQIDEDYEHLVDGLLISHLEAEHMMMQANKGGSTMTMPVSTMTTPSM